jgi:hypothetical protein
MRYYLVGETVTVRPESLTESGQIFNGRGVVVQARAVPEELKQHDLYRGIEAMYELEDSDGRRMFAYDYDIENPEEETT